MYSEILTITPNEASKYLANNPSNRRISERAVAAMAADMKAGRWLATHQGIAIGKTGRLLDGQHRLSAVIKAGVPVKMMATFDVDESAIDAIDQGRKRSVADCFTFSEEEVWMRNKSTIAAARLLISNRRNAYVSPEDVRSFMNKHCLSFALYYKMLCSGRSGKTRNIHSSVGAAIVAAHINGVSEPDLVAFFDLYAQDKMPDNGAHNCNIVLRFKSYMMENKMRHITPNPAELYKLASNVIFNFVKNTKTTLLRTPDTEKYVVSID